VFEITKWFIWIDEVSGFILGPNKLPEDIKAVEEFDNFEDARKGWKFYCDFLQSIKKS
jgi:hypothetical protein